MNKKCAKLVGKITEKSIQITAKHDIAVFVDYSGHVDLLQISVRADKEDHYKEHLSYDVIYAKHFPEDLLEEKLSRAYLNLCSIYKTGYVPDGLMANAHPYRESVKLS